MKYTAKNSGKNAKRKTVLEKTSVISRPFCLCYLGIVIYKKRTFAS